MIHDVDPPVFSINMWWLRQINCKQRGRTRWRFLTKEKMWNGKTKIPAQVCWSPPDTFESRGHLHLLLSTWEEEKQTLPLRIHLSQNINTFFTFIYLRAKRGEGESGKTWKKNNHYKSLLFKSVKSQVTMFKPLESTPPARSSQPGHYSPQHLRGETNIRNLENSEFYKY